MVSRAIATGVGFLIISVPGAITGASLLRFQH